MRFYLVNTIRCKDSCQRFFFMNGSEDAEAREVRPVEGRYG